MSVRGGRSGKGSHEQRAVRGGAGGRLFNQAAKGITPVRGAAGGLLFLKARHTRKHKLAAPSFEHVARAGRHRR